MNEFILPAKEGNDGPKMGMCFDKLMINWHAHNNFFFQFFRNEGILSATMPRPRLGGHWPNGLNQYSRPSSGCWRTGQKGTEILYRSTLWNNGDQQITARQTSLATSIWKHGSRTRIYGRKVIQRFFNKLGKSLIQGPDRLELIYNLFVETFRWA